MIVLLFFASTNHQNRDKRIDEHIEPPDRNEKTEIWYEQIIEWVNNNPPKNIVKSFDVFKMITKRFVK